MKKKVVIGAHALVFAMATMLVLSISGNAEAQEIGRAGPTWYPFTIARPEHREMIQTMPLHHRPNRPLHFYGNAIRRDYYRGTPIPTPRDFVRITRATIFRR